MCFSSLCRYGLGDTPITDEVFSEFDHSLQEEFGLAFRNSCAYGIDCEDDPLDWRIPDWYAPTAAWWGYYTTGGVMEKDSAAEWYQSEVFWWHQKAAKQGFESRSFNFHTKLGNFGNHNIKPPPITSPGSLFFHNHVRSKAAASSATAGTGSSRDGPLELDSLGGLGIDDGIPVENMAVLLFAAYLNSVFLTYASTSMMMALYANFSARYLSSVTIAWVGYSAWRTILLYSMAMYLAAYFAFIWRMIAVSGLMYRALWTVHVAPCWRTLAYIMCGLKVREQLVQTSRLKAPARHLTIMLLLSNGRRSAIEHVNSHMTIAAFKNLVHSTEGYPADLIRITYAGKALTEDSRSLSDCGVRHESRMEIMIRNRGGGVTGGGGTKSQVVSFHTKTGVINTTISSDNANPMFCNATQVQEAGQGAEVTESTIG